MNVRKENGENTNSQSHHSGLAILLGDSKEAIIKLSIPIIISLLVYTIYQIIDMVWVSGLGADAISSVGFYIPVALLLNAVVTGLGVGGGTLVSQRIGAKDKDGTDKLAGNIIILTFITSLIITVLLYFLIKPLFIFMGAGKTLDLAVSYAKINILGIILFFFSQVMGALMKSEGDTKRQMIALVIGLVLNMILDPVFIYLLGFGVAGAAISTLFSMSIVLLIFSYWFFIKKNTYINFSFKEFSFRNEYLKTILKLGVPVALNDVFFSLMIFINTIIVAHVGGTDGVAVYSAGWRIFTLGYLPLLGANLAFITVIGTAYGAKKYDTLSEAYKYFSKIGFIILGCVAVFFFFAAPLIAKIFTWSEGSNRLAEDLTTFFRVFSFIYPSITVSMIAGSFFIGIGDGLKSLIIVIFRTLIFTVPCAVLFGIILKYGLFGVWTGLVIGNWATAIFAFVLIKKFFNNFNTSIQTA